MHHRHGIRILSLVMSVWYHINYVDLLKEINSIKIRIVFSIVISSCKHLHRYEKYAQKYMRGYNFKIFYSYI